MTHLNGISSHKAILQSASQWLLDEEIGDTEVSEDEEPTQAGFEDGRDLEGN